MSNLKREVFKTRSQTEKNVEILWDKMEELGEKRLTSESMELLIKCRDAYETLCMLCENALDRQSYRDCLNKSVMGGGHLQKEAHYTLTYEAALGWTERMKNEDGTSGPHWTMEQTEQVRKQKNIDCDPIKFFVAMNMIYSDYCKVAEKVNANSMDFYAYMSKAFLDDKDAQPDKLARYYHCIAKR